MCSWAFFKHTRLSVELLVIELKMIRSNKLSIITGNDTDEEFIKPQLENQLSHAEVCCPKAF